MPLVQNQPIDYLWGLGCSLLWQSWRSSSLISPWNKIFHHCSGCSSTTCFNKSKLLQRLNIYLYKSFINLNQWMHKAYLPSFGIPRLNHYRIRYICTMLSYSLLQLTNQTVGSLGLVRQVCLGFFLIVFFIGQTLILFLIHNKSKIWFKIFI